MPTNAPLDDAVAVTAPDGLHVFIDSEAMAQAVYLFQPVFGSDGCTVVDLVVIRSNAAARRLPLADEIHEGVAASTVFVDFDLALAAANLAWSTGRAPSYPVERRGMREGQPVLVHFDVATFRVDDLILQVSVDHTMITLLAGADARFRAMAEASGDTLALLAVDPARDQHVVVYANPAARLLQPGIEIGEPLPPPWGRVVVDVVERLRTTPLVRLPLSSDVLNRHVDVEATFTSIADGQVMFAAREITSEEIARAELERSERVLRAIGAGSFGTIAVYEPHFDGERLVDLSLMWSAAGHGRGAAGSATLDPTSVLPASELLAMAQVMLANDEPKRTGWVQTTPSDGIERSIEFTLVTAGDRFVVEFVERTEELAARTALAMVSASSEAQRSFVSRVSHEMRSPLNVIQGYTQLLGRLQLPDMPRDYLTHIEQGVERMVSIVDDLLLLGQLDQGLLRLDEQRVAICDLAADVIAVAGDAPWREPGSVAAFDAGNAIGEVYTDRQRFTTVASLLLQASLNAAPAVAFAVGPYARGTRLGVQLVMGADSPVVETVWLPFVRSHTIPGSGLGLAVARSMAKALAVDVEVRPVATDASLVALVLLVHSAP